MLSLLLAVAFLLAVAVAALRLVPRHGPGPAWTRQLLLGSVLFLSVVGFGWWAIPRYGPEAEPRWTVGELRSDGLRLVPTGRSDAADVLPLDSLEHPSDRDVYRIATEIPAMLNRLYCWCGCIRRGRHRSALACFEDRSAVGCGVCRETARIAGREVRAGTVDPARVQRTIDREWAPPGTRIRHRGTR